MAVCYRAVLLPSGLLKKCLVTRNYEMIISPIGGLVGLRNTHQDRNTSGMCRKTSAKYKNWAGSSGHIPKKCFLWPCLEMPYMGVFLCQIIHNLQHVDIVPCSSLSKEWCCSRAGKEMGKAEVNSGSTRGEPCCALGWLCPWQRHCPQTLAQRSVEWRWSLELTPCHEGSVCQRSST